jgi:peptide/nickel transport system substrate-binding protein
MFKSDSAWNESGWKSEKFDSLLVQARGETDETKRRAMYSEMQGIISDQGSILIPNFLSFYDVHSAKVGGLSKDLPTCLARSFAYRPSRMRFNWRAIQNKTANSYMTEIPI